ncbi:unnamed protein product [Brachionus calyciflorus]|uniref:DOMON domain-containing protein n=1 Tax=Brachionus calyciflorus TaxID=104777 RepID=A0A813ZDT2_9BILA|nr:unnamed protein product [Brachionus calyciflorus]
MKFSHFILFLSFNNLILSQQQQQQTINLLNSHIQWKNTGLQTEFSITSNLGGGDGDLNNAWLAIGLNPLSQMTGANAIVCQSTSISHEHLGRLYTVSKLDPNRPSVGLSNSKLSIDGSNLTCSFTRENNVVGVDNYLNITENSLYHVLVAYGFGKFDYHLARAVSKNKVSFPLNKIFSKFTFATNESLINSSIQTSMNFLQDSTKLTNGQSETSSTYEQTAILISNQTSTIQTILNGLITTESITKTESLTKTKDLENETFRSENSMVKYLLDLVVNFFKKIILSFLSV